jgi:hypothetical protein
MILLPQQFLFLTYQLFSLGPGDLYFFLRLLHSILTPVSVIIGVEIGVIIPAIAVFLIAEWFCRIRGSALQTLTINSGSGFAGWVSL